jgi:hypothetical protein
MMRSTAAKGDPVSGNRTIVSGKGVGRGPAFEAPLGRAIQANRFFAVCDAGWETVLQVNPSNSNRSIQHQVLRK